MGYSQQTIAELFRDGKTNKNGSNFFSEHDAIYSYGHHFPLVFKRECGANQKSHNEWYLINGDKYSITTTQHQSIIHSVFIEQPTTSFSALSRAGINPQECNLIDSESDLWYNESYNGKWPNDKPIPQGTSISIKNAGTESEYRMFHRAGCCLLEQDGKYWICGMDENSYFVSLLPDKAESIESAFLMLKPLQVQQAEKTKPVLRQGEWFCIPLEHKPTLKKNFNPYFILPEQDGKSSSHIATRGINIDDSLFIFGTLRHSNGDHKMLRMDKNIIYQAFRNTAIMSFSESGVD